MSGFENALPPAGPAKHTQKQRALYEIDRRDRLILAFTLLWCFLLVDIFLWTWPWGAGFTAVVFAWYALLAVLLGHRAFQRRESRVLLVVNLCLAAAFALNANWYFRSWNFLALLALAPIQACGLSGGAALPWWRPAMLKERFLLLARGLFGHLGAPFAALSAKDSAHDPRRVLAAVQGSAGALALLGLLVPVLASADALFAAATADLRRFMAEHLTEGLVKLLTALVLTPFVYGLLYSLRRSAAPEKAPAATPAPAAEGLLFLIMLTALDLLYLLFLAVQSAGLFGGADYLARRGISYAEWARSGFFQMAGVTVINLSVTMAALAFSRRTGGSWKAVRGLAAVLALESLVLLASAAWRMTLYVSAYGLSFKRGMTYWGMVMMALFLLLALGKICRPDRCFLRAALPLALAGWLVINCVPLDYLVAKDQVDRYLNGETPAIDAEYLLYGLSYSTLSQLERLDGGMICRSREGYQLRLETLVSQRREEARQECADWRSWNLSACLAAGGK